MDILFHIYQYAVWFFAGLLTGLTSFGGNLFAIPLLTLVMPAQDAIVIACLSGMVMILALSLLYWRAARWGEIVCLGLSTVPGVVLGVAFLQHAGPRLLLLAAGAAIVLFLLWQFLSGRLHVGDTPVSRWWGVPCGLAGGL
ncbi:MAG: sulfite exporter TauE/SafE family protein, partial [Desulfovibrio sp.]|nr:sulfite exporter TauE/SafE family protein [Desulfovibrio sp.]